MSEIPVRSHETEVAFITEGELDPLKLTAGPFPPPPDMEQHQQEFYWMVAQLGRPKSMLEIGSREGGALKMISQYLEPGARICSIDIGERHPEWQNGGDPLPNLHKALTQLRDQGFDVHARIGDSQDPASVEWAKSLAPFDFVFIDANHSYEAAKNDLMNYGPMATVAIGIHDIVMVSIGQLWSETTGAIPNLAGQIRHGKKLQMIVPESLGVGVIKF